MLGDGEDEACRTLSTLQLGDGNEQYRGLLQEAAKAFRLLPGPKREEQLGLKKKGSCMAKFYKLQCNM